MRVAFEYITPCLIKLTRLSFNCSFSLEGYNLLIMLQFMTFFSIAPWTGLSPSSGENTEMSLVQEI